MTGKVFYGMTLAVLVMTLAGCVPRVSPEGYVYETPLQAYMRNMPTSYAGQRAVVLKPPPAAPVYEYSPAAPTAAPIVSSQPLPPPSYIPPAAPASPQAWTSSQTVTTEQTTTSYAPPAENRIRLTPPAAMTREVDYGDNITIYPLDSRDAPMPYIPPAYRPPMPIVTSTPDVPAGYNP